MEDLFGCLDTLPEEVQEVVNLYYPLYPPFDYESCEILVNKLNEVGYTCDYGLDGVPFNLTKLN